MAANSDFKEDQEAQIKEALKNLPPLYEKDFQEELRADQCAYMREYREEHDTTLSSGEIESRIKMDPKAIKEASILKAMGDLKFNDPIEYDLLISAIKKSAKGLRIATIDGMVNKYALENQKAAEKVTEIPKAIRDKALAIATRGDSYKYLIWQAQRNHLGDIPYQKVLIASIASTASLTSNGIQPGGTGESGSGKDHACASIYHLMPVGHKLDGSLSPMSLFYMQSTGELIPGMILYSEDVEYLPIMPMYKRYTARFQQGLTHRTVSSGQERKPLKLNIPPRISWWLTSVESVANAEANTRQYPISTDSDKAHKEMVSEEIGARRARKEPRLAEDEGILVAREIIADIYESGPFQVAIPQAKEAKWLKASDFRGQEQFWDLVDALAIIRWRQRAVDSDGWLIAADEDIFEAKEILTAHKVANLADLTPAEVQLVGVLAGEFGLSQKELTEKLGIAQCTISQRLKSIMAKSPIITEDTQSGKKVYALNPNMELGQAYWNNLELIKLDVPTEAYYRQQMSLLYYYLYVIGVPIGIIINSSNRIPTALLPKKLEVIGNNPKIEICNDLSCERCLNFSLTLPNKGNNTNNAPEDSDFQTNKLQITASSNCNNPEEGIYLEQLSLNLSFML